MFNQNHILVFSEIKILKNYTLFTQANGINYLSIEKQQATIFLTTFNQAHALMHKALVQVRFHLPYFTDIRCNVSKLL